LRDKRTRARRGALVALTIALAGVWTFAATRLWRTSVPDDLEPPRLDERDYFPASLLEEASSYTTFLDVTDVLSGLALLVALGVFAVRGAAFARESAAGRIGTGMLLGMLALAFVWIAQLPFGLARLWWQRRHDTTEIGYLEWLADYWAIAGAQFLFISLALLIVMALAGVWRRWWWLAAAPALAAVAVAFTFVQPYLLPGLEPVRDPRIAADVRLIAAVQGISEPDVRVLNTYGATEAPNAFAAGLGPSERVVLWDTLVEDFDRPEVRIVIAHELGHLSRDHIWKTLAWMALIALPTAFVVGLATRRRGGIYEPAAVPLAVFVVAVALIAVSPLDRAFSQRLEAEADWVALETTRDPEATEALFAGFASGALIDPSPAGWSDAVLATHPSTMSRIEMAAAWASRHGSDRP